MPSSSLEEIDFEDLVLRLTSYAAILFGVFPGSDAELALPGDGSGPDDLAMATVEKLLDPDDKTVKWSSRKKLTAQGLLAYLKRVLRNDFLDLKKSKRYQTTVRGVVTSSSAEEAEEGLLSLDEFCAEIESPEGRAVRQQQREQLLKSLADVPELQELLMVQLDPEGYQAFRNQDLAVLLEVSVDEVVNRKKRLSRWLHGVLARGGGT